MDVVFEVNKSVFNYRVAGIWIENEHVLLHKMAGDKHWSLPGGRVGMMEDSHSSIKREIFEELGIHVKVHRLVWTVENFFPYNGKNVHEIGLYYIISPESGESYFQTDAFYGVERERLIFKWTPIEQLEEITLYPLFLKKALKNLPSTAQHIIVRQ